MSSFLLREVTVRTGLSKKSFEEERDESDIQMCSRNLISWEDFYPNNLKTTYHSSWRSWNVGVPVLDDLISFERQRKLRECMQKGMMSKMKWMCDTKSPCIWGQKGKVVSRQRWRRKDDLFAESLLLHYQSRTMRRFFPSLTPNLKQISRQEIKRVTFEVTISYTISHFSFVQGIHDWLHVQWEMKSHTLVKQHNDKNNTTLIHSPTFLHTLLSGLLHCIPSLITLS